MAFSVLGLSLPQFWSALLFQMFFCARLGLLPPSGYQMGWDIYIVLPALTLTWPSAGLMARITRVAVVDVVGQDYVRTARAKGINPLKIAVKHIARNALIPMVTLVGTDISRMIGGMIMIEVIFTWPGMGKYVYDALIAKDFPAFQASTLVIAALIIGINILVDITYGLIDPRISYE
ncbi:MAG TPA: hypothetical protein DDZ66_04375 [Firmicutes bacterium]|jgi:ABC-type dipeptide/oligopeptide/nickel transport system permease component|nr:hypothetical protein [Bacillota bacterium]